jgi:hypothetical protein
MQLKVSFFASEHGGKWFEIINRFEVAFENYLYI